MAEDLFLPSRVRQSRPRADGQEFRPGIRSLSSGARLKCVLAAQGKRGPQPYSFGQAMRESRLISQGYAGGGLGV
jgi:hypothetical protein